MAEAEFGQRVELNIQWLVDPQATAVPANQWIIQAGPPLASGKRVDGFFVTFGSLNPAFFPPPAGAVPGEPLTAEQLDSLRGTTAFVAPVARLFFTEDRLRDLSDSLTKVLAALDATNE